MQREITITILKENILQNSYFDSRNCPISRALKRAGYEGLQDCGYIVGTLDGEKVEIDTCNEDYHALLTKLFSMYNSKNGHQHGLGGVAPAIPIEDFTVTINF